MSSQLIINNIGPIKNVNINLSPVNVFIGKQSSGKSTIAKIISFCKWLEKHWLFFPDDKHYDNGFINEKLIKYHNFENYFAPESNFYFESDAFVISYSKENLSFKPKSDNSAFSLIKNAYIPSERNLISLPGFSTFKIKENYIKDFIEDWLIIRNAYSKKSVEILDLDCQFIYNPAQNSDEIILRNNETIPLESSSSGLQSITPLYIIVDYLTSWIYSHRVNRSAEESVKLQNLTQKFLVNKIREEQLDDILENIPKLSTEDLEMLNKKFESEDISKDSNNKETLDKIYNLLKIVGNTLNQFTKYNHSNIVIEEPEQNLFPETQVKLLYYILEKINVSRDFLVVTTHSPYILYALNNSLLAFLSKSYSNELQTADLDIPEEAFLDPSKVSVWEVRDGVVSKETRIQDRSGLVKDNYFDSVMGNIMADFNNLLSIKIYNESAAN